MSSQRAPEIAEKRRKMRLRSGVRASAALLGVLLLLFLLYFATRKVLIYISERHWEKTITAAIKSGESQTVADLLEKCRKQAPYLQHKRRFHLWQKEFFKLLEREKFRRQEFSKRLNALQQQLKDRPETDFSYQKALTSVAAYASTDQEFAEVRKLEAHCRTLEKLRTLKSAQAAVKDIEVLENDIVQLQQLAVQQNWQEYQKRQTQIRKQLTDAAVKYPAIPEFTIRIGQIQSKFDAALRDARQVQLHKQLEKDSFQKLFAETDRKNLLEKITVFIKKFPRSEYIAELKKLQKDLAVFDLPFKENLLKIEKQMTDNNSAAQKSFRTALLAIIDKELQYGTFELILRTVDNRIVRFETLSKCFFTRNADNTYSINFTAVDNSRISGIFHHDGSGRVNTPHGTINGTVIYGKPQGALPESSKQRILLKIQQMLKNYNDKDFPLFLYFLQQQFKSGKLFLLPMPVKTALQEAVLNAEKCLKAHADQFIFTREIIARCRENTPVFAGIIHSGKQAVSFVPSPQASAVKKQCTLWVVDTGRQPYFIEYGTLCNGQLAKHSKILPPKQKIYAAAIPEQGIDYAVELADYMKSAEKNRLEMPPLPEFLRRNSSFEKR